MAYATPQPHGRTDHRLPSPTAEPDPDYCYMNTLYTMHNTQSQLPVNGNDVVTSIATIGTFEAFIPQGKIQRAFQECYYFWILDP